MSELHLYKFLGKIVETFEETIEKTEYLEGWADGFPERDRIDYFYFGDWVEDYDMQFTYKGTKFKVVIRYTTLPKKTFKKTFVLGKKEESMDPKYFFLMNITNEKGYELSKAFKATERKPTLETFWKDMLRNIESTCGLETLPTTYYYDKWAKKRFDNEFRYDRSEREKYPKSFYELITKHLTPSEIETRLNKWIKESGGWSDGIELCKLHETTKVELFCFLDKYVVQSIDEFYVFDKQKEAYQKHEEEQIRRVKEIINREIENKERSRRERKYGY